MDYLICLVGWKKILMGHVQSNEKIKDIYIEKNASKNREASINFRTGKNLHMTGSVNNHV